ncbi:biotin carboxylase N-terminal domain-containing protein, partial [Staphylococcus epidermidis]|uniref:biotin carboxylase N-terminal domain-containing protein n=1 Tax=Staphylococcus epidermidis TaxID=1282 RepID=UPI0037D996AD
MPITIFTAPPQLNITTLPIYSNQHKSSLHTYKPHQSYLLPTHLPPPQTYFNIQPIIQLPLPPPLHPIHPPYPFLTQNQQFPP